MRTVTPDARARTHARVRRRGVLGEATSGATRGVSEGHREVPGEEDESTALVDLGLA